MKVDTMTYEEYNDERREMGLDIDPQYDDTEGAYVDGYTNDHTFDFILACDQEIFEDFQKWALPLLQADNVARSMIQQSFLGDLYLDSDCFFSDIEIFNIWYYKTNRTIYWICDDQDTFKNISDKFDTFEDMLDYKQNPPIVIPFFVYATVGILVQIFYINPPFLGVAQAIEHHSIWGYATDYDNPNCNTFLNHGDDSLINKDHDEISNWDVNNADISDDDLKD